MRSVLLYTRNLIEASLDPLATISSDGKITDVNRTTEEITGVSRKRLIGADFSSYFTEPAKAREGYEQVFTEGSVRDYPLTIRHISESYHRCSLQRQPIQERGWRGAGHFRRRP